MDPLISLLAIVLCIGSTQGTIFGIILLRNGNGQFHKKVQAAFLFILSYGLLIQVLRLYDIGYYDTLYHLTLDLSWSYGPLFYLFVKSQVTDNYQFTKKERRILIPIILQVIISIYVRQQNFFWDGTKESLTWLGYWGYVFWMNYPMVPIIASSLIIVFCWKSWKMVNQVDQNRINENPMIWIKQLIFGFGVYYGLVLTILISDFTYFLLTEGRWYFYFTKPFFYPFFIGEALLLYWFGITGIMKKDFPLLKPQKNLQPEEREQLEQIAKSLTALIDENENFKNPELTVAELAKELEVKAYLITKTLNDFLNTSFTDFINARRVQLFKELMEDPTNNKYTILSLAHQAGFNSKSSMNRAVQKHLGKSPSELRNI